MLNDKSCGDFYLFWELYPKLLGDSEITANIYCKSRKLPNTDTQISVQICGNFWVTQ